MKRGYSIVLAVLALFAATAAIELWLGRLRLGPDGAFGWWESNIWSSEQSQRFADPYSFSHIVHGVLFYAGLWLVAPGSPMRYRFLAAVVLECAWEVLENSPIIINRYRAVTISLGYVGDSVLNSISDILMMCLGFAAASLWRVWMSVVFVIGVEVAMALWVRDNLALNIIMLVRPVDAIRAGQMGGQP